MQHDPNIDDVVGGNDDLAILESIYRAAIVSETLDAFKHELNELTN